MSERRPQLPPGRRNGRVSPERTGWRDANLSLRHRQWGVGCPAIDMDLILVELNRAQACALIEYKGELAQAQFPTHPSYLALSDLGNKAAIPVFAVRYAHNFSWFRVVPLNTFAKRMLATRRMMNERQYVTFLYNLRGTQPPEEVFELLETAI